ncbi:MAG TPA: biotin/lipoyl-containing protein [Candidatus Xenobia bacterium]|jgi:3-methylcrotonyl-CoA carboxylase alpha subunit
MDERAGWRRQVRTGDTVHEVTLGQPVVIDGRARHLVTRDGHVLDGFRSVDVQTETDERGRLLAVWISGRRVPVEVLHGPARLSTHHAQSGEVLSPMNGQVVKILAQLGEQVEAGASVVVVEAMKMENEIRAPVAGRLARIDTAVGRTVAHGEALFEIHPEEAP